MSWSAEVESAFSRVMDFAAHQRGDSIVPGACACGLADAESDVELLLEASESDPGSVSWLLEVVAEALTEPV